MLKWVSLAAGSCLGGLTRYMLSGFVSQVGGANFPYGTLTVNLAGCFLIGFLAAFSDEKFLLAPNARLLLMVGFCGAFTTFSTFMLETSNLIRSGNTFHAFVNVAVSITAGFLVFRLGMILAELI